MKYKLLVNCMFLPVAVISVMTGCKSQSAEKELQVSGTITNNTAKMIYLEEVPVASPQRIIVDSAQIDKNGKYKLNTDLKEAAIYNLRLDQSTYPLTSVINDTSVIVVNAVFNKQNGQFAESYEVKGSPASQQMKDFMLAFNGKLQSVFFNMQQADSLRNIAAPDSLIKLLEQKNLQLTGEARALTLQSLENITNPALAMFILGYYQSTANNPAFRLEPVQNEMVAEIVNNIAAKFPDHMGVAAVKNSLNAQMQGGIDWTGKPAPEIKLPDPDGKMVSLSSFRGKYVLVDFWASWCKPCRMENPNVVKTFNKYRNKNFTVLGVSLDRPGKKDEWLRAIMDDNLTWTHISDLQFWSSPVVALYGVQGIPFNVLIDPEGKVIGQQLMGSELDSKLGELLK